MKKITIFSIITLTALTITYNQYNSKEQVNNQDIKLADARLSYNKIEKDLTNKIDFIKENITKNGVIPNKKELDSLISSIETIRSYGKDLTKESKSSLKTIVKILKEKHFKYKEILNKLNKFITTSQNLVA